MNTVTYSYPECKVIHVVSPVPSGTDLSPDRFEDTVADLAVAYGNVFRAFLGIEESYTALRLSSFFDSESCGLPDVKIAALTYAALDRAF